jgi:hypothetical protein
MASHLPARLSHGLLHSSSRNRPKNALVRINSSTISWKHYHDGKRKDTQKKYGTLWRDVRESLDTVWQ